MRVLLLSLVLVLATAAPAAAAPRYAGVPATEQGLRLPAKVQGGDLALATASGFAPRFWPGVNLGATIPGHHPGEVAPARRDYDRWLAGMHDLGVRAVRVYTILRPAFYDALAAHNRRHADAPLYVIHGIWAPEDELHAARDAHAPAVTAAFDAEIADAVAVVHGDARLPARRGRAHGTYRTDISRWVLAWSPGVEWDPGIVAATDARHAGMAPYQGARIAATPGATPFESWLAARLDRLAALDAARGWSRPVTFTNWVTTDPLRHPAEPLAQEDAVSVDARHLAATPAWPGGFFVSYHAYPYYPDFLRFEYPGADPYAGYLRALRAHHAGQAVMVTEFGVPSGIGIAHSGPLGRDQGGHTEREQGRHVASMLRAVDREGFAGAVAFMYVDEWFKRSWNTMDLQDGERRPLWRDALTNEQAFGLVASEPASRHPVRTLLRGGPVRELRATHDEGFLRLTLRGVRGPLTIGLDNRPGGAGGLPGRPGVAPGADVALQVSARGAVRVLQASAWEPVAALFGEDLPAWTGGPWTPARLMLSRPLRRPDTGEQLPPEVRDVSVLPGGAGPDALVRRTRTALEIRVPWLLAGYGDPSSRRIYVPAAGGAVTFAEAGALRISVAAATGPARTGRPYAFKGWNAVRFTERRKAGWATVRAAFRQSAG